MDERVKGHLIAGHRSAAAGADLALDVLGLSPVLELGMQLGEGTGALAACLRCGKKIPEERLRALPYAVLCLDCKNAEERPGHH